MPKKIITEQLIELSDWKERLEVSAGTDRGFAAPGGEFTKNFFLNIAPYLEMEEGLRVGGKPIIELGAGMLPYGYYSAKLMGASSYVGVEPFYPDCLRASISLTAKSSSVPYTVANVDMLSFLDKQPSNSSSILCCGIEKCILPSFEYAQQVEREVKRVLGSDHIFLSLQSDIFPAISLRREIDVFFSEKERSDKLRVFYR